MKKSMLCAAIAAMVSLSGCTLIADAIAVPEREPTPLEQYQKAEKTAKVASGALVVATAIKMKADADLAQAKANLETDLKQ